MKDGFIKVASSTPDIKVADCKYNSMKIIELIEQAARKKVKIIVLPELCITGYTCGDLFFQTQLLESSLTALNDIIYATKELDILAVVGLPVSNLGKLYNCAAVISHGELLGLIPKVYLHNHNELCEARHFTNPPEKNMLYNFNGKEYPFGAKLIFECLKLPQLRLSVEICEDLWVINSPSIAHTKMGATIIANPSASDELSGKHKYRADLVKNQSAKTLCAYIFSGAGDGESTTDMVLSAHNIIAQRGKILAESKLFENSTIICDIDLEKIINNRQKITTFTLLEDQDYKTIKFDLEVEETHLEKSIDSSPFIPQNKDELKEKCTNILNIQSRGLKKRLLYTNSKKVVIGVSGGSDSTLALINVAKAVDMLGKPREDILAVTMPCFGTTQRTKNNAYSLIKHTGATHIEIDITNSVNQHFKDINYNKDDNSVVFENAQARMRMMVLMDIANKENGLVVGTSDLTEIAMGFSTYAGDHMSMYNVNCGVPKTLIKHIIRHQSEMENNKVIKEVMLDIINTPISPELLPENNGKGAQKTEEIIGPFDLNDFFLYYIVHWGFTPSKICRIAKNAFKGKYSDKEILKWLKNFYTRFFKSQYKRSCMPDGPKIGSVGLSPRSDFKMPSDACVEIWIKELDNIK